MTQIESESDESQRPAASRRVISLGRALGAGLACLPLLLFALGFARFSVGHTALGGVTISGEKVAGASLDEVKRRLDEHARALAKQKLTFTLGTKRAALDIAELGIQISPRPSAERALAVGRNAGFFRNAWAYLRSLWSRQELAAVLLLDGARLEAALLKLEAALIDDPPFAGAIHLEGTTPSALPARAGRKIAPESARSALSDAVALGRTAMPVALSAVTVTPVVTPASLVRGKALAELIVKGPVTLKSGTRQLSIEPLELAKVLTSTVQSQELVLGLDAAKVDAWLAPHRAELERPARDAAFQVSASDEVSVVAGEPGEHLAAEEVASALWAAAQRDERVGELPLRHEPLPARSTEQAQQLGIKQLVGSFTTRHPCCQPRVDNIHRIAFLMDGLVVEPGQTVSVNAVVGPRTQKNGFVLAPSIEDGEMVDTVGGGVSQFATTFFNALFHAGYDILERQPHTYWFPRYPMGHEATLSWPKPDIVFKNDSAAGLLVKTSFSKTSITVKLYGDAGGRKVSSSVSERRDIVKPPAELLPNRDVPPDEEKVKEGGMIGWSVIAARTVTFADGTKKEERRKVTYKPKARRVEVHPCRIPDGEPGATGEPCPEPPDAEEPSEAVPAHAE